MERVEGLFAESHPKSKFIMKPNKNAKVSLRKQSMHKRKYVGFKKTRY